MLHIPFSLAPLNFPLIDENLHDNVKSQFRSSIRFKPNRCRLLHAIICNQISGSKYPTVYPLNDITFIPRLITML